MHREGEGRQWEGRRGWSEVAGPHLTFAGPPKQGVGVGVWKGARATGQLLQDQILRYS